MASRHGRGAGAVKALGLLGVLLVAALLLMLTVVVVLAPNSSGPTVAGLAAGCLPQPPAAFRDVHLDDQQQRTVRTIIAVGHALRVPPRGWVVALATGMQESLLRRSLRRQGLPRRLPAARRVGIGGAADESVRRDSRAMAGDVGASRAPDCSDGGDLLALPRRPRCSDTEGDVDRAFYLPGRASGGRGAGGARRGREHHQC